MTKQTSTTAVEWLVEELETQAQVDYSFTKAHKLITLDYNIYNKLIEQAKQMEKEQIEISDEKIEKAIIDQDVVKQEGYCHCFLEGAKWYREQLKNK